MKKKNLFFWACVVLVIALLIFAIVFSSVQSCSPKDNTTDPPVNPGPVDPPTPPSPPGHEHDEWVWDVTQDGKEHFQYRPCHPGITRNRGPHVYDNDDDEYCNICNFKRSIPIKQDKIEVEFGEDGASVGGFTDSSVPDLVIPGTVTDQNGNEVDVVEIKEDAFRRNATINSLEILEGVKKIGKGAFSECSNLKKIIIPSSVIEIDPQAFYNCRALESITVNGGNPVYRSFTNCLINRAERSLIVGSKKSVIPVYKEDGGTEYIVTSIGAGAFYGSGIEEIDIPENITSIGAEAFKNSSLTKFTVPEGIKVINASTFDSCASLTTITLHDGITSIGQNAFANCSKLDDVTLPANLTTINGNTFQNCTSLKNITLNEGLRSIQRSAFNGCTNLRSITLPSSISSIGIGAFADCSRLASIVIPAAVLSIGNGAFTGCRNLESITVDEGNTVYASYNNCIININEKNIVLGCKTSTIPTTQVNGEYVVTSIGDDAFNGSGITGITIPENITSIGARAFQNCTSLNSIVLSESLTKISTNTFYGCTALESITLPSSISSIGTGAFGGCTKLAEIIYNGTENEWNTKVSAQSGWKSDDVKLKFKND